MYSSLPGNSKFRLVHLESRVIYIIIHRLKEDSHNIEQEIIKILPPVTHRRFFDLEPKKHKKNS